MDTVLNAVLARYPSVARPSNTPEPLGNAGGLSGSRLWRFPSGLGTLLVRAWPIDGPPQSALLQIHDWLKDVSELGFVSAPIRGLDGRTLYEQSGRLWEVIPWMPGCSDPERPPTLDRVRVVFAALGAFHQRLGHHVRRSASPGLDDRRQELEVLIKRGFTTIEKSLESQPDSIEKSLTIEWVESARRIAPSVREELRRSMDISVACQPCLRDVRPDHFLFTHDRLTGLIDFGAMGFDAVSGDLARLAVEWLGDGVRLRKTAFEAYSTLRPLTADESSLIAIFERSAALLGPAHWARWHFLEGRVFDDPLAVRHGLEKGLSRMGDL